MTGPTSEPTRRSDPLDELAALFLTDESSISERALPEPAFRELLIVGHLPVRGGVWLTPYADAIARSYGPTALVRFDLVPPTMELLRAAGLHEPNSQVNGMNGPERASMTFREAVERAAGEVAVWIVRGPTGSQPADLFSLGFDRITILTSADSAAVVAAYRIIKDIVGPRVRDDETDVPAIAVAIAGADESDAAEVVRRLDETASAQLGIRVELSCCIPRMDSGVRCETFASFAEDDAPTIADLLEWIDAAAGAQAWAQVEDDFADEEEPVSMTATLSERPPLRLLPRVEEVDGDEVDLGPGFNAGDVRDDQVQQVIDDEEPYPMPEIETMRPTVDATRHAAEQRNGIRLTPKVSKAGRQLESEAPIHASDQPARLTDFVAGLALLPVQCPGHDTVELASDDAGRLHVLAREESLRELYVVENWARAHRKLTAMACADRNIDEHGEIVCHIFTDKPATLADLHGTGLRLHVLAPVRVGAETAWYSAPLSA